MEATGMACGRNIDIGLARLPAEDVIAAAGSATSRCFGSGDGEPLLRGQALAPVSTIHWALMTSVMFIYALINTGMALYVLPVEAMRLHPGSGKSIWVGICIAACGTAQLINPIAGKLSDRHVSPLGRRRPYIVSGTVVAIIFLTAVWASSVYEWPNMFIVSLLMAELGLNVAYAAQCGLPADIQAAASAGPLAAGSSRVAVEEARGVSSGVVALHSVLGSMGAMSLMLSTRNMAVQVQYPLYITGLAVCCTLVCHFAREQPTHMNKAQPLRWYELKSGFMIDMSRDTDFFWVCLGRMFYYVVTSVLVFQLYYLEDMIHLSNEEDRKFRLCILVFSAQIIGALSAVPFGRLSNVTGRKLLIYAACFVMSFAAVLQIVAPKVGPHGSWPLVWASSTLAGLGNSAYLSVDYALALDCLPQGKSAAEAFGLWGLAGFAGSTFGPLFGGLVLHASVNGPDAGEHAHYTYVGYASLFFVLGIVMNACVSFCTVKINLAK